MATILVVDDEEPIVALLQAILEAAGHTVLTAYNGREGLARARAERPDLVLSDVMMPLVDGRELARLLRETSETAATIVVLMSAAGPPEDTVTGMAAFLSKPFTIEQVDALIAAQLAQGEQREQG